MDTEIPEWLIEMSKQMNENEKRCTSHPFWQVRNKKFLVTEEGYNEHHWEIINQEGGHCLYHSELSEDYSELAKFLIDDNKEWCKEWVESNDCEVGFSESEFIEKFSEAFDPDYEELPDNYRKFYLQEVEEVLTTNLTKEDAEWFIQCKKHDYPNAYTYVESAYWSPQLRNLQDWIKSLTNQAA